MPELINSFSRGLWSGAGDSIPALPSQHLRRYLQNPGALTVALLGAFHLFFEGEIINKEATPASGQRILYRVPIVAGSLS